MYKEEITIKILEKVHVALPGMDLQKLRNILDETLYDYAIHPMEKALVTQSDIWEKLLLFLASKKLDGLSDASLYNYRLELTKFSAFIQKKLEDITTMDIRMYLAKYAKENLKIATMATKIATLKSFFNWLENEDYIHKSPTKKIKQPKAEKRLRKALTVEELEIVREACETLRERALVEFLYCTGCRLDEAVQLNRDSIDWQNLSVRVIGKGNKERKVYITPKGKHYLQKYLMSRLDDCEALFVTVRKTIKRLSDRSIERIISDIGKRTSLNKPIFPHLLRHTTATLMLDNGADLVTVQHILGHEDPATTQIYAEVTNERVQHEYRKHLIQ